MFKALKERYTAAKADPWVQMKAGVGVALALIIWSFYVVVGRACVPIIQHKSTSGLGRATGVGVMIGYIIIWLLFIWSYVKMLITGPGFARNHVPKADPPKPVENPSLQTIPYVAPANEAAGQAHPFPSSQQHQGQEGSASDPTFIAYQQPTQHSTTDPNPLTTPNREEGQKGPDPSEWAPVANAATELVQHPAPLNNAGQLISTPADIPSKKKKRQKKQLPDPSTVVRPVPIVYPGPRWCRFCEINKPDRTHHCRHCGTCIMQFDHHCLWVGQCVGWANHKFFMTFTLWGTVFCLYIMIFLIVVLSKGQDIDGQFIALIALSALFGLFTSSMFFSHLYLIMTGRTTVESFVGRDQAEQESTVLNREYGIFLHNQKKKQVVKRWNEEWGNTTLDERWKWGTKGQLWRQDMGDCWIGWILPVGRPLGDGITFKSNPRFGPNGEWLRKSEWPPELGQA